MSHHWLSCHNRRRKMLRYDARNNTFTLHEKEELTPEEQTPRPGTWTRANGSIYGISPSARGPVFFCEGTAHLLEPGTFTVSCQRTEPDRVHFVLTIRGEVVIEVCHTPERDLFSDYFGDEDEDFFEWFSGICTSPRFFTLNTRTGA